MTDGMLAREALERKEAWAFLGDGVRMLLASSPEFRERCREMLGSGRGCLEFEEDLRGAVLGGAARGASEVLSELDGELSAPSCEGCGARMHRRGTRALSLLGRLELKRGRRPAAVAVRTAAVAGGAAVRVRGGEAAGGGRGRREVDLEHSRGTVPERRLHRRRVVESSCGTLVAARFKRGGMRWSRAGANDILPLRACIRSGPYDDLWRQRRGPPIPAPERLAH